MKDLGLYFVNGRRGSDAFTCILSRGSSVVDYCMIFREDLPRISNFVVKSMSECV